LKEQEEEVEEQRRRLLAKALLKTALESPGEEEDEEIGKEDQNSLLVGIIGPPNVGKFALTNFGFLFINWPIPPPPPRLSLDFPLHRELGEL
jgi:putative protein kinase ArgK-like GTPase of G3E family